MTALRVFLPRAGVTLSTRERAEFRDRLLTLGATRFSAGSSTGVGGYAIPIKQQVDSALQFEITDERSVGEVTAVIVALCYDPVIK